MRIGIDVGGTNTDAALMDGQEVLATSKQQTTADVTSGVVAAIESVLGSSTVSRETIDAVMVGTTHFVNAFVQRRDLNQVAIVRVALPMTDGIPPLVDWPEDLRSSIGDHVFMVGGGSYYTGVDYVALDEDAITAAAHEISRRDLTCVAITSVFAPIRTDLETRAEEIIRGIAGDGLQVTLSHQVGGIGLIERENAAVINASLQGISRRVVSSLKAAMQELSLDAQPA